MTGGTTADAAEMLDAGLTGVPVSGVCIVDGERFDEAGGTLDPNANCAGSLKFPVPWCEGFKLRFRLRASITE